MQMQFSILHKAFTTRKSPFINFVFFINQVLWKVADSIDKSWYLRYFYSLLVPTGDHSKQYVGAICKLNLHHFKLNSVNPLPVLEKINPSYPFILFKICKKNVLLHRIKLLISYIEYEYLNRKYCHFSINSKVLDIETPLSIEPNFNTEDP